MIGYDYGSSGGLNDRISRLDGLTGTSVTFEQYSYLGLGTVVRRAHEQPDVDQTYIKQSGESDGDAGDQYIGLDRFGRVVDQRWLDTGTLDDVDRYQYTYDRDSNRLTRDNLVDSSFDESYGYDGLNQLDSFDVTGTSKSWDYDAAGNWDGVTTNSTTEDRTHNAQNEIESRHWADDPHVRRQRQRDRGFCRIELHVRRVEPHDHGIDPHV